MISFKNKKGKYDFIIAGLGNPGAKYALTRHNAGFAAIDKIADSAGVQINKKEKDALTADANVCGKRCLLVKPQTFMNLSGEAVIPLAQFYKVPFQNVIIIYDDVEFDVGRLRIRRNGSHGGHNGMRNIIEKSGSQDFPRVKIGVGKKPSPECDLANWVLGKIPLSLADEFSNILTIAADAVSEIVSVGIDSAMNKYNR